MKIKRLTNPLLRFSYWQFRLATKYLGDANTQNKLGFCAFNWLTPFIERYGYDWTLHYRLGDITHSNVKHGRVVKAKSRPEYDPTQRTGGRVTKAMPRQLRKIKEGQEATGGLSE